MDQKSEQKLNEILGKDQGSLTSEEKGFLRARRSYLNDADTKRYADILKEKAVAKPKATTKKKTTKKKA